MLRPTVRHAVEADAPAIVDIYNHAVATTTAVWNNSPETLDNRLTWMASRQRANFPVLVAAGSNGQILGYGSFGDWRAWDGYRLCVEHSVYVAQNSRGSGIGGLLLQGLIDRARDMGKHAMIGGIEAENAASIRLHERLGFACVAHMPQVGIKFGRWLDLKFFQLTLDERSCPPG